MTTGFVSVPVPEDRVIEVYALLASDTGATAAGAPAAASELSSDWSETEVRACYRESSAELKLFFELLADQPTVWLRSDDLYPQLGYTPHQFAGALGAFGRKVRGPRYRKNAWFFEYKEDPVTGIALYRLDETMARLIKKEHAADT